MGGRDGAGEHRDRVDTGQGEGVEPSPGGETEGLGLLLAHDQHGGSAVADLRRVAGGDHAVGFEGRLEVGQCLDGGAGADALVRCVEFVGLDEFAGLLVAGLGPDGDDLVVEATLGVGPLGPLLAQGTEGVEVVARQAPLLGDDLGRDALGHQPADVGIAQAHRLAEREADVLDHGRGAHGDHAHDLDAGGDDDVVGPGHHALGGEMGRLLRRTALTVDGGRRDRLGPAGGQHRVAPDVERLRPDLHHAAHDDVVDERGVEIVALGERLEGLGGEVDRVPARELSVALASGGADGVDDDCGGHGMAPLMVL